MGIENMDKILKILDEYKTKGFSLTNVPDGVYRCEHPEITFEYKIKDKKMISIKPLK